jgi:hypothetical protein
MRVISIRAFALALVSGLAGHGALAQSDRPWVDPPMRRPAEPAPPGAQPSQATAPADAARPSPQPPARASEPSPQRAAAPPGAGAPSAAPAPSAQTREPPPPNGSTVSPAAPPGPPGTAPPNDPAPAVPARKEAATAAETLAGAYLDYWSAPNAVTLDATPDFYAPRVEFHGRLLSARALFEEKKRFVRRWPERQYTPRSDTLRTACDPGTGTCVVKTVFDFIAANPARRRRSEGTGTLELVVSVAGQQPVIIAETSRILRRGEGRDAAGDDDTDADD